MARSGREGKKKGKGLGSKPFNSSKTAWVNRFIGPIVDSGSQARLKSWSALGVGSDRNGARVAV